MNRSKIAQNISERNAIQSHVSFWDKKSKGYITPVDIIFGFISLGYGILTSIVLGAFTAVVLSVALQVSWLPDIFFRFSASALVISRQQLSGVFDKNGILVPQKFEILFKRHAKFGDKISMMELFWLTKEQEQLGFSPKAWIVAIMELCTAYFLVGQDGFINKQNLRDLYNGTLFFEMENRNSCQPKVLDFVFVLPSRLELFKSQMLNAFNLKYYYDTWKNATKSCNSQPIKKSHTNIPSKHRALDGHSEKQSSEKKLFDTVVEEHGLFHGLLKEVSHLHGITIEKTLKIGSQDQAIVRIETAVVLHSSNYLIPYDEPLSLVSDVIPCDFSACRENSLVKVETAIVLHSSDLLLTLDDSSVAASCDDFTHNSPDYCDGLDFYSDSDYCGVSGYCDVSDYCDVSGFSDSSASSDNLSSCDTLSSCNDSSLSDMYNIQSIVSIDCSSRLESLLGISNLLTRDDSPKISEPIYALPTKNAIQLFCDGWYRKSRKSRKGKKAKKAL
ncbi:unnamed protein product [Rhizopus stolonifer]